MTLKAKRSAYVALEKGFLVDKLIDEEEKNVALRAENERLRAALKPFADESKRWANYGSYRPICEHESNVPDNVNESSFAVFTIGDLFRAAALLAQPPDTQRVTK